MDKETLENYRYLKKEIRLLEQRIDQLHIPLSDRVTASNTEFPYQEVHLYVEGVDIKKQALEEILRKRLAACLDETIRIEDFISSIEDSRTRMIFQRRYIDGWPWIKISVILGSKSESYARMIHDRILKKTCDWED